jgi:hypothetical protein
MSKAKLALAAMLAHLISASSAEIVPVFAAEVPLVVADHPWKRRISVRAVLLQVGILSRPCDTGPPMQVDVAMKKPARSIGCSRGPGP